LLVRHLRQFLTNHWFLELGATFWHVGSGNGHSTHPFFVAGEIAQQKKVIMMVTGQNNKAAKCTCRGEENLRNMQKETKSTPQNMEPSAARDLNGSKRGMQLLCSWTMRKSMMSRRWESWNQTKRHGVDGFIPSLSANANLDNMQNMMAGRPCEVSSSLFNFLCQSTSSKLHVTRQKMVSRWSSLCARQRGAGAVAEDVGFDKMQTSVM
jgi:hypothetical protein